MPEPTETLTRRQVIVLGGILATTSLASAYFVTHLNRERNPKQDLINNETLPISDPLVIAPFPSVKTELNLSPAKEWNANRLQDSLDRAVAESLAKHQEIIVELPEGEIIIDKRITSTIPEGAKIKLKGNEKGSRLRLHEKLSDIPKEWESFAKNSMLFFKDMEGEITLDGIEFHGGSERAGKHGYTAPPSPWNSVVFIVGKGEGDKYEPAMHRQGSRKGKALVENCSFYNSESHGVLMQNIHEATVDNIQGKNLDVLFNATWCDDVVAQNCVGENLTSDGIYITSAAKVRLKNWSIKTARQGYDLQGVKNAELSGCHAYDCAKAFELTSSETDRTTVSDSIKITNSDSSGCMVVYSIGPVNHLKVEGGNHDDLGGWIEGYRNQDFMHTKAIVAADQIAYWWRMAIMNYDLTNKNGQILQARRNTEFSNVTMRVGKNTVDGYRLDRHNGITYVRSSEKAA